MEALQGTNYFCCVEFGPLFGELHVFAQVPEQFASVEKVHDKVQLFISLECVVEIDNKGISDLLQDFPLS
jgi:hypothetical protein